MPHFRQIAAISWRTFDSERVHRFCYKRTWSNYVYIGLMATLHTLIMWFEESQRSKIPYILVLVHVSTEPFWVCTSAHHAPDFLIFQNEIWTERSKIRRRRKYENKHDEGTSQHFCQSRTSPGASTSGSNVGRSVWTPKGSTLMKIKTICLVHA